MGEEESRDRSFDISEHDLEIISLIANNVHLAFKWRIQKIDSF